MVGLGRFELPTSRLSGVRSNQLSYRPYTNTAKAELNSEILISSIQTKLMPVVQNTDIKNTL